VEQNIPPPPATASSSSTCSSHVKKNIAFDSPCDNNAEKTIRIESCSRPTKTSRKHRNSSFLNRIRLGKGEKEDRAAVAIDDNSRALRGLEQQLSFSSCGTRDIASMKRQPGSYKKYSDGQSHDDSYSKNLYPKSKSDEKKSPMKGIKRFMRKKNHVSLPSSSSGGILYEGYSSLTSKQEKDQYENNKNIDNEETSVKDGARIHFHDYDSSHPFVVKKRKSDEGLPSALVQVEQTSLDNPICHCFDEQKIEQRSVEANEKDHKRLRESLSPIQNVMRSSPSSSSAAELTMPPVENLALYCSENMKSVGTSSSSSLAHTSDVVRGDINSSLSSNSPMSMEPDAFSSLYQDDSDDDIDDDEDNYPIHETVRGIDFGESCKTNLDGFSSPQSRQGYENDGEDDDCCQLDQEDESDSDESVDGSDEDDSDASTVVNSLPPARPQKPPPGATKEEQDRFYWELCYGKASDPKKKDAFVKPPIHFSASTKVPTKSCLSAKKTPWTEIANSASKRIALKKSLAVEMVQNDDGTPGNDKGIGGQNTQNANISSFSTPQGNDNCMAKGNSDGKKSVKFGELSAAEFESTRPTVELTPLPAERVKEEFGLENKSEESDDDSAEMHQETARNADKLAMWEDDFDSYCEDWDNNDSIISMDDDSDEEKLEAFIPRKTHSRDSVRRGRTSMGSGERKRGSSERRSSIFFSKSGGSLLEPEDMNMDSQCALKDNPIESPRCRATRTVENSEKGVSVTSRDSLQFSSPSTIGGSFIRLSHSGSENSKVTPTTEITSSSNILRSVHSEGGASISGIASRHNRYGDECADLIPSQLDYALKNANGAECNPKDGAQVRAHYQVPSTINCSLLKVGELLQGVQTNFLLEHDISSLLAIEDTVSNIAVDFIDIIQDLDVLYQQSIFRSHQTGGYEVLGILEMALSLLEEVNSSTNDFDERKLFRIIESMNTSFDNSEIEETYSLLSEIALINWLQQEAETLEAAKEWLLHILHFNHREEQRIIQVLSGTTAQNSSMEHMPSRRKENNNDGVMVQIEEMENDLLKGMKELETVEQEACILAWKCELERSKPEEVRRYQLLTTVLSYDCALDRPPLSIQIYHLDGTQTLISWDVADDTSEKSKRDSICTVESIERTAASMMTVPNTNRLRFKAASGRGIVQGLFGLVLSEESEAYKLYTHFLDGVELQKYMKGQFQLEHEMGILTVSDTFQRMNLMALDVLDLEKNNAYKLEVLFQNSLAVLQILLKISESCIVEIRFSYDLSSKRTFFSVVPTDVSVQTLLGTTATIDTKGIIQIARNILNNNLGTNAFILKRTCSAILESLKARNLG
jgi:hypothetical protein